MRRSKEASHIYDRHPKVHSTHLDGGRAGRPWLLDVQGAWPGLQHICCRMPSLSGRRKGSIQVVCGRLLAGGCWLRDVRRQAGRKHLAVPWQRSGLAQIAGVSTLPLALDAPWLAYCHKCNTKLDPLQLFISVRSCEGDSLTRSLITPCPELRYRAYSH